MRTLKEIAREIKKDWVRISPYALPYVEAMETLKSIHENYYMDTAGDVVMRFLCNAQGWRGDVAKRVKAELKSMLEETV